MKILVTGDKGFIGSALVKRLQTEKHEVVGIDTKAEGTRNICQTSRSIQYK